MKVQLVPHVPQFRSLNRRSTHWEPHAVDGVAQETVLDVEVVVFVDFVVREGVTAEVPGLMVVLELELENEGIREEDEESSFKLDGEGKVL
jgi:hypothetical protein